ncbi:DegT/DnrJ/EryC1/StrS family aminotransferase [Palleronia sp.]|uniref:DegT/DnrJ/EryC1/StrS family aminotransferase n=1 Tax=Palleronia sp. TaxID=1940284 RepID=UPI0035C82AFB
MTPVPFFRPSIGEAEIAAVTGVLRSGWLTTAGEARAFEAEFAEALGGRVEALAVTSATAALHLGLEALGVGPGDEVILPTLTFTATAEVVRYMGATPVLVDIEPDTLCMSTAAVEAAVTPRTRTIMPVHFAGRSCDMTGLRHVADRHGLTILDDAAHALPTRHKDQPIGGAHTGADVTAFSFYANKTMTTGEGGMLVTARPEIAARARTMRLHGIDRDVFDRFTSVRAGWSYDVVAPGFKYNMTDIAAAMGRVQLSRTHAFHAARSRIAANYDAAFADLPLTLPPKAAAGDTHAWHLYVVELNDGAPMDRDTFLERTKEAGIGTSVHYRPLHQMSYWREAAPAGLFPAADAYFERCATLPLFMDMRPEEEARVIDVVRGLLG